MSFPIDAVITWVDGSDPAHAAKLRAYGDKNKFMLNDVAGTTRYANNGEIYRCVASIRKFAPFVRTIFIVTDGQDPHIPEGNIPVKIIDHKEIFRGYEQYLPVFNSIAIETMTWRIPGLAEHYIKFNDDLLLSEPTTREDFFEADGKAVCYTKKYSIQYVLIREWWRKKDEQGHKRITFKWSMTRGAKLAGARMFMLKIYHTPQPLNRLFFEQWFSAHPEWMELNISFRFRDAKQFTSEEAFYYTMWRKGQLVLRKGKDYMYYLEPRPEKEYMIRRLNELQSGTRKFCCFNSLDKATEADRKTIMDWMDAITA